MQTIIKSNNLPADVEKTIRNIHFDKLFILTDEHTHELCLPLLKELPQLHEATQIITPADDTNKTIVHLSKIWKQLTENGATRHSLLVNLGGGMVTDLGGFAAATFKRGIKYINIPTTRSEEHTSELQSRPHLVCRLLLEKKKTKSQSNNTQIIYIST